MSKGRESLLANRTALENAPAPDSQVLRAKYREERQRRLRPDGEAQYVTAAQKPELAEDPYLVGKLRRPPVRDQVEVAVIGGGLGGLLAGARLRQAGTESVRIIEKGGDLGGTWYWNRYPGIACDIDSYIYMPLLEELGTVPSEKYARGAEIFAHCQSIGRHFGLYEDALLQTEVTAIKWLEDDVLWRITTDHGDVFHARFVVIANGLFNRPKLPRIPGLDNFRGHSFHTSRWDYTYTGGDPNGKLTGLADKRVGIIGTGATALQCVPMLAQDSKHLFVFQRTPSSVDVRGNKPTDPEWVGTLSPGWQRQRILNWSTLMSGGYQEQDLVEDAWTDVIHAVFQEHAGPTADFAALMQLADDKKMEQIRARVDRIVTDRSTAEALKPWYSRFCKRPGFHDAYLDVFNRPNVTLVDTAGRGVERVTETGLVAGGKNYDLDCLIFATGFDVDLFDLGNSGYVITGRDGQSLADRWKDGASTLHGMTVHGLPNLFLVSIVQAGLVTNVPHLLSEQSIHIAYLIRSCRERGATRIESTPQAEQEYAKFVTLSAFMSEKAREECTPGYYNKEGTLQFLPDRNGFYEGGCIKYFEMLEAWRAEGLMRGLELRTAKPPAEFRTPRAG